VIHDLLKTDPGKDSKDLLALSAYMAIKVPLTNLNDGERKKFADLFRNIAVRFDNNNSPNTSLWRPFWRRKRVARSRDAAENV
jgi:hypothetical protein